MRSVSLERKLVYLSGLLFGCLLQFGALRVDPLQIFLKVKFRPTECTQCNSEFPVIHQIGILYEAKSNILFRVIGIHPYMSLFSNKMTFYLFRISVTFINKPSRIYPLKYMGCGGFQKYPSFLFSTVRN